MIRVFLIENVAIWGKKSAALTQKKKTKLAALQV